MNPIPSFLFMNPNRLASFAKVPAVVLWLMLASGCDKPPAIEPSKSAAPATPVEVATTQAGHGPIARNITLPATVRALQQVTLYAKVAGYLKTIRVDRGDLVKEGDLIAEVEAPELLADQAKFAAEVDIAQTDFQRLNEARQKAPDLVMPLTVDTAKSKLEMATANFKRNETLLAYTKINAPFSGVITKRWVDTGALIPAATGSSSPQNAAVVTLMDFSTVRIEMTVPEPETPLIRNGLAAEIKVEELAGKTFTGTVTRFAQALDETTKTMATEIEIPNPEGALRPGMFATVKLAIERKTDALIVPSEALVLEKAKSSVFTVVEGKAKKIPVTVGFQDGKFAEIFNGLAPGAIVILPGKLALTDGQAVKIAEAK
jgi:membrane fusion protein (multidrug efflux system)